MKKDEIIKRHAVNLKSLVGTGLAQEECDQIIKQAVNEVLILYGVGSSTYKIAINDGFCTYDFEMQLPKTTCIRDIAKRLYVSFGLKEDNGRLRE